MNCQQAKKVPVINYIEYKGYDYTSYTNHFKLKSPFRKERTPSFVVYKKNNIWIDFGASKRGDIIDLVCLVERCTINEALVIVSSLGSSLSSLGQKTIKLNCQEEEKDYVIKKVVELKTKSLIAYVKSRKIDLELAKLYLKEIHYTHKEKYYYGVCFLNNSKGYEVRNPYYKGTLINKDITTFLNDSESIVVFEGCFDMMSYKTLNRESNESLLILNSLYNLKLAYLILEQFSVIKMCLDNDEKGSETSGKIVHKYPEKTIIDKREKYRGYGDLNEYLTSK
ncbi:toprim domain-containing protein [Wenyingzhuangia sp. IMCC45574]